MKSKWLVLALIWLMMLVAYFDRINLATAGDTMMSSLHLDKAHWGYVLSAFTFGYAIMQAPGGHLADKLGAKRLLVAAILIWSAFTGLTGLATSLAMLIVIRIVFGFGEGLENGAQFKLVGDHFTPKERSLANSIFLSALALGPAIGTLIAAWTIGAYGWREMFYAFALLGLVVGGILLWLLPPEKARGPEEKSHSGVGFREVLKQPTSWLCAGGYFLFNIAFWGFLSWVPTYLRQDRHIPLAKSGVLGSLPYFAGFLGMVLAGILGSTVMIKNRAVLVSICYVGAAGGLLIALTAQATTPCLVGLCIAGFFLYGGFGPAWGIAVDLAPPQARGVFTGAVNCCGQIGGFLSQITIGYLAHDMKSFSGAILFMVGALVLGSAAMAVLQGMLKSRVLVGLDLQ